MNLVNGQQLSQDAVDPLQAPAAPKRPALRTERRGPLWRREPSRSARPGPVAQRPATETLSARQLWQPSARGGHGNGLGHDGSPPNVLLWRGHLPRRRAADRSTGRGAAHRAEAVELAAGILARYCTFVKCTLFSICSFPVGPPIPRRLGKRTASPVSNPLPLPAMAAGPIISLQAHGVARLYPTSLGFLRAVASAGE